MPAPSTRLRARLRRGSRTSPAVKVTLFQASAANSEPTIAPPATISASSTPPDECTSLPTRSYVGVEKMPPHQSSVLAWMACELAATVRPTMISAINAAVLATVKTF